MTGPVAPQGSRECGDYTEAEWRAFCDELREKLKSMSPSTTLIQNSAGSVWPRVDPIYPWDKS